MYSKRFFIITTVVVSILAFLWIGHTAFTNAAGLRPYSQSVSIQPTTDSITAVLSGTNTVSETFKLVSTNPITDGRYGRSVAIYEDTLIVGEDHGVLTTLGTDAMGYLYIHERHAGGFNNWGVTKVITPSDGADGHGLGTALVFDGETLIAGAITANGNADVSGAAYVFERNHGGSNNWGEVAKLVAPDGAYWDRFGWTVSFDGDTAVVGARWHDHGPGLGAAYIYERNAGGPNNWGFVKELLPSNPAGVDLFGISAGISGDTIVIGASDKNLNGTKSGLVYIFERNEGGSNNWGEVLQLAPVSPQANDRFGDVLAIDENVLAVGAPEENTSRTGAVYLFERNSGGVNNWGQNAKVTPSDGQPNGRFSSLDIDLRGDTLVVGAPFTNGLVSQSGAAYVFKQDPNNPNQWHETAKLVASDGAPQDEFGISVSFYDDTFVVGAFYDNELCPGISDCDTGTVYVYTPLQPFLTDLSINKTVSAFTAVPNQPITYTLVYTNHGPSIAFHTLITDIVPSAIVNPAINYSGPTITQTGATSFIWEIAPLSPGESGTITITGIINPELAVDMTIVNTAVITNSLDITPTNNMDTAVVQIIIPESIYLPVIMKPALTSFPINISDAIATEPTIQSKTFYTTTIFIPSNIPVTGQFFLSAHSNQISKIGVDDELAIVLDGKEIFVKTFALNGSAIHYEIVEVPRNVMEQMAGQTVSVIYRDVYGQQASASAVWLIWVP